MQTTTKLTKQELSRLEACLASPVFKGKAMRPDKLQGFLCAVASAPDMIPPSRWMPEALGGEPEYDSFEQAQEVMGLLMRFYNDANAMLGDKRPPSLLLQPTSPTDPRPDYATWCDGYILGWSLSTQEWLRPGHEPLKALTFPILLLSGAFKEHAEQKGKALVPEDEYEETERKCAEGLPAAVAEIYRYWLAKRRPAPQKKAAPKVGRNDPCPCGSGRKFKLCCGKEPTLH
jgi:uncharacterized protein